VAEGLRTLDALKLATVLDLRQMGHITVLVAADQKTLPGRIVGRMFGRKSRATRPGSGLRNQTICPDDRIELLFTKVKFFASNSWLISA
jgi:hypothetical protein